MITHFAGRRVRYAILFHELLDAVWRVLLISENTAGLLSALLPGSTDIDAYSFVMSGGQISIRPSLPLRLLSLPLSFVRHSKGDGDLVWPTIGPATLIPQPNSSKGSIEINSHIQLFVYVGETSHDDYIDYVEQCIEMGFNVDYNRGDNVFDADNEIGDSLRVEYEGNNIMSISMYIHDWEEQLNGDF